MSFWAESSRFCAPTEAPSLIARVDLVHRELALLSVLLEHFNLTRDALPKLVQLLFQMSHLPFTRRNLFCPQVAASFWQPRRRCPLRTAERRVFLPLDDEQDNGSKCCMLASTLPSCTWCKSKTQAQLGASVHAMQTSASLVQPLCSCEIESSMIIPWSVRQKSAEDTRDRGESQAKLSNSLMSTTTNH